MAKSLDGKELQGFIKERQLKQVRQLRQAYGIKPRLTIIVPEGASEVIGAYVRLKRRYAEDVLIDVEIVELPESDMKEYIKKINIESNIQGIIVQLPLKNLSQTEEICNSIDSKKDVDGLGSTAEYNSATAEAIDWLLAGYNVSLEGKKITLVGHGKLVGGPLGDIWQKRNLDVTILDERSQNIRETLKRSDIIVSAAGVPRLVSSEDIQPGAVVIDAGTTSENGTLVGDVDVAAQERQDITITPLKGGVGPMTIAVLFDHVIQACQKQAGIL